MGSFILFLYDLPELIKQLRSLLVTLQARKLRYVTLKNLVQVLLICGAHILIELEPQCDSRAWTFNHHILIFQAVEIIAINSSYEPGSETSSLHDITSITLECLCSMRTHYCFPVPNTAPRILQILNQDLLCKSPLW